MNRKRTFRKIAAITLFLAASFLTAEAQAGWPLGRPHSHTPKSYHGYRVEPTYSYMPVAFPYGRFGATGYSPRVVMYDYNYYLRTWGPWPGH